MRLASPALAADRYPWYVLGEVAVGTFMGVINQSTVNLILPTLAAEFESPASLVS